MDEQGVMDFLMKLSGDAAIAAGGLSVAIGDRLGLYTAMSDAGPMTAGELAERTGLVERYVEEWLAVQAGLDYVRYDPGTQSFELPEEHAAVLADENSPTFLGGVFPVLRSLYATEDGLVTAFRVGGGVGWDEHGDSLYRGTARLFRPGYRANIVDAWLPALDEMVDRLRRGRPGSRPGVRVRLLDHHHGRGLPSLDVRRHRLSRGVCRRRGKGGRRRRGRRPGHLRGCRRDQLPRRRVRPDHLL